MTLLVKTLETEDEDNDLLSSTSRALRRKLNRLQKKESFVIITVYR